MSEHVLIDPATHEHGMWFEDDTGALCAICDGGLAVCSECGAAEAELDGPCHATTNEGVRE